MNEIVETPAHFGPVLSAGVDGVSPVRLVARPAPAALARRRLTVFLLFRCAHQEDRGQINELLEHLLALTNCHLKESRIVVC